MDNLTRKILLTVFQELKTMPRDEFLQELNLNGNGDIATFLLESGAFEVRTTEAEEFEFPITISASPEYSSSVNFISTTNRTCLTTDNDYFYDSTGVKVSLFNNANNETYATDTNEGSKWKRVA